MTTLRLARTAEPARTARRTRTARSTRIPQPPYAARSTRIAALAALAVLPLALVPAASASANPMGGSEGVSVSVTVPSVTPAPGTDAPFTVSNASFRWGINAESGSGAFYGGCNFLSAGAVGDTGSGKLWTATDGYFRTTDGAVTIEKPNAQGAYGTVAFERRCEDATGQAVTTGNNRSTGITALIGGGTGSVDPGAGTAQIAWKGSFTVVAYGGLAYWWITDPQVVVDQGTATVTATASGFGSSRDDTTIWTALTPRTVTLATLKGISLTTASTDAAQALGFTAIPDYRGVNVTIPAGGTDQVRTGSDWGSFPQTLVDFHQDSGQASYFYSSGGARDAFKPATRLWVSYDADAPVTSTPDPTVPPTDAGTDLGDGTGTGTDTGTGTGTTGQTSTGGAAGGASGSAAAGGGAVATPLVASLLPAAALAATTVLPLVDTLIPQLTRAAASPALLWSSAGVLSTGALAALAFQRGWLTWPTWLGWPAWLRRNRGS